MTGVEILAAEEVVAATAFCWPAFWSILGVFLIGMIILGLYLNYTENAGIGFVIFCIVLGLVAGTMLGAIVGGAIGEPIEYETEYKVIIDDTVSMTEFLDKYEILDQEGKIYTVKERE